MYVRNIPRVLIFTVFLSLVTQISFAVPTSKAQSSSKPMAMSFSFIDMNGKNVNLSTYKGKWVLVNFWAPWCPICFSEIPTLNELNAYDNFVVLGIAMDYGPDEGVVRRKVVSTEMKFEATILGGSRRDSNAPFRSIGPVDFFPTSYLYDPNGEIVMFIPGAIRKDRVAKFINSYKTKLVQSP